MLVALSSTRTKRVVTDTKSGNKHVVALVSEFICISSNSYKSEMRDYYISLHGTMAILPNYVIVMTRHNGRIDGAT